MEWGLWSTAPARQHGPARSLPHLAGRSWETPAATCDLAVGPPGRAEAAESGAGAGRVSPGTNLPGRVLLGVQSPTRTPFIPSGVLILGMAIAQGLQNRASLPRRGRKRTEQWGRQLCSSWGRKENPSQKPWNTQHAPNPWSGQGCLDEVQSCFHQHFPSLKPTPLSPTAGWGEGSAHHS